jgi:hypothetical protein
VATSDGVRSQRRRSSSKGKRKAPPTSEVRVDRNVYQRVNRDGSLGRFRAIGAGGVRRTFDTLEDARAFRDREADLTPEQQLTLKPDS